MQQGESRVHKHTRSDHGHHRDLCKTYKTEPQNTITLEENANPAMREKMGPKNKKSTEKYKNPSDTGQGYNTDGVQTNKRIIQASMCH